MLNLKHEFIFFMSERRVNILYFWTPFSIPHEKNKILSSFYYLIFATVSTRFNYKTRDNKMIWNSYQWIIINFQQAWNLFRGKWFFRVIYDFNTCQKFAFLKQNCPIFTTNCYLSSFSSLKKFISKISRNKNLFLQIFL